MNPELGYKLDWLLAEKVMGWTQEEGAWLDSDGRRCGYTYRWEPSRDIAAAWQVVERLAVDKEFGFELRYRDNEDGDTWWECSVFIHQHGDAEATTAPHAISLAALAAMEAANV